MGETFLDRLRAERGELFEKATKLKSFIHSQAYSLLNKNSRNLLFAQWHAMSTYLNILDMRVDSITDILDKEDEVTEHSVILKESYAIPEPTSIDEKREDIKQNLLKLKEHALGIIEAGDEIDVLEEKYDFKEGDFTDDEEMCDLFEEIEGLFEKILIG